MADCSVCGEETNMPYACNYCGRNHCASHKLPENHDCPNVAAANTLGPEFRPEYQDPPTDSRPSRAKPIAAVAIVLVLAVVAALLLI